MKYDDNASNKQLKWTDKLGGQEKGSFAASHAVVEHDKGHSATQSAIATCQVTRRTYWNIYGKAAASIASKHALLYGVKRNLQDVTKCPLNLGHSVHAGDCDLWMAYKSGD
jgi:hypothetical protein